MGGEGETPFLVGGWLSKIFDHFVCTEHCIFSSNHTCLLFGQANLGNQNSFSVEGMPLLVPPLHGCTSYKMSSLCTYTFFLRGIKIFKEWSVLNTSICTADFFFLLHYSVWEELREHARLIFEGVVNDGTTTGSKYLPLITAGWCVTLHNRWFHVTKFLCASEYLTINTQLYQTTGYICTFWCGTY